MRKSFALTVVALLALTMALAAVGCGQKAQESSSEATSTGSSMGSMDTTSMMSDTAKADTSMHQ